MIFSDRQRSVAQSALEKLNVALANLTSDTPSKEEWLLDMETNALKSQIADLQSEIQEFDMLKDGQVSFSERYSLADLPRILIQARIAKGLSQSDLASELDMKPQQIQRYEASEYMGASLSRLIAISEVLEIRITQSFTTSEQSKGAFLSWSSFDDVAWEQFPAKEMIKRGWLEPANDQGLSEAVETYFLKAAGQQFASAFHRKKVRGVTKPNEFALLAWQARILELAQNRVLEKDISSFNHNDDWLYKLTQYTREEDGPKLAKELLEENGILLVLEKHLTGSYLDGAAMMSPSDNPVIGMTLRYDRLDNFWFVLFHELGHVYQHLFDNLNIDFFDEDGTDANDTLEREADQFALDTLISPHDWNLCLSRFALTDEAVKIDAEKLNIHPSIIAGRIRKERKDYTILNKSIGQGKVRHHFEETV